MERPPPADTTDTGPARPTSVRAEGRFQQPRAPDALTARVWQTRSRLTKQRYKRQILFLSPASRLETAPSRPPLLKRPAPSDIPAAPRSRVQRAARRFLKLRFQSMAPPHLTAAPRMRRTLLGAFDPHLTWRNERSAVERSDRPRRVTCCPARCHWLQTRWARLVALPGEGGVWSAVSAARSSLSCALAGQHRVAPGSYGRRAATEVGVSRRAKAWAAPGPRFATLRWNVWERGKDCASQQAARCWCAVHSGSCSAGVLWGMVARVPRKVSVPGQKPEGAPLGVLCLGWLRSWSLGSWPEIVSNFVSMEMWCSSYTPSVMLWWFLFLGSLLTRFGWRQGRKKPVPSAWQCQRSLTVHSTRSAHLRNVWQRGTISCKPAEHL